MKLDELRNKIDEIDEAIIELLKERFKIVEQIMSLKSTIEDKNRENEILTKINNLTDKSRSRDFFTKLYKFIFEESKRIQEEIHREKRK